MFCNVRTCLHIGVGEAVLARLDGSDTGSAQGRGEKRNVALLVLGDAAEILIVGGIVTSLGEVGFGELLQGSDIESILEMFELFSSAGGLASWMLAIPSEQIGERWHRCWFPGACRRGRQQRAQRQWCRQEWR